jgi:outer membrane protein
LTQDWLHGRLPAYRGPPFAEAGVDNAISSSSADGSAERLAGSVEDVPVLVRFQTAAERSSQGGVESMIRSTRAVVAVGLCLVGVAGLVSRSFGQQGVQKDAQVKSASNPAAPAVAKPASIGSIDMDKVLKDYDKFKVANENIRAEALERHNSLMKIATDAKQEQEKYQRMTPGSPDAKKCEDRITQLKAQFEAGRENAEREFTQKEAETMATIYNEIATMARGVATQRGMAFVVKYTDAPASGSEPNSVVAAMSRTILFADPSVDITGDVIKWLNYRYKASGGPAPKNVTVTLPGSAPAPGPATRPAGPGGGN